MTETRSVKIWDAGVRLFHWGIVLLIATSWATAEFDAMAWHLRSGYCILALLLFRLAWGVLGSDTARFARFLQSPAQALEHLRAFRSHRGPDTELGHNAAGGWMVLAMLGLLLAQVATGLFANEEVGADYAAHGPLALSVADATSEALTELHELGFNLILALVVLHVVAVLAYALVKRHDLVRPMVTGFKRLPAGIPAPRMASPALAATLFGMAALVAWAVSRLG